MQDLILSPLLPASECQMYTQNNFFSVNLCYSLSIFTLPEKSCLTCVFSIILFLMMRDSAVVCDHLYHSPVFNTSLLCLGFSGSLEFGIVELLDFTCILPFSLFPSWTNCFFYLYPVLFMICLLLGMGSEFKIRIFFSYSAVS